MKPKFSAMKTKITLLTLLGMISTLGFSQNVEYDDMYFNKKDREKLRESTLVSNKTANVERVNTSATKSEQIDRFNPTDSYSARNVNPDFVDNQTAKKRAEFAKNYISVNYGIAPDRIDVDARNLPEKASSTRVEDGIQENRRIEITSNVPMVTEPLIIEKDRQTFSTTNLIEFEPKIESSDSITTWNLEINQTGKLLISFGGTDMPGKIQWNVQPNELKQSDVPVDYTLVVENAGGKQSMKSGTIPVEYLSYNRKKVEDKPDKIISKYSLVVFDFDSPEISEKDKEILKKNVIPSINYNSVIQIYGYTDRIGDDSYNQKLALRRAESVKKFLEPFTKSNKIEVYGIGENIEIFDNDLPVGRQLSRTVQIYVITPKEK